jgi:hypothetical protein
MTLPHYDAWLEPPDPGDGDHQPDCVIDHDPTDGECVTRDDLISEAADIELDRRRDGGWG